MNYLFTANSIIFNYSFNTTSKSSATLYHNVLGHLGLLLLDSSFKSIWTRDLVGYLLKNMSHSIVSWFQVWFGAGSEIYKINFSALLHFLDRVPGSIVLGYHILNLES